MIKDRPLVFLLIVYLTVAAAYAVATPPFEASDEVFHYPFVRNIALGRGLPVQRLDVKQPWEQVAFHPPAYYYIAAALTFWIDTSDFDSLRAPNPFARIGIPGTPQNVNYTKSAAQFVVEPVRLRGSTLAIYLLRVVSVLMSLGTITFTYLMTRLLFSSKVLALLAASLLAFNPEFVFISASVNNDNLTWLICVFTLFIALHQVRGRSQFVDREIGSRGWDAPMLGLLLGVAALTKVSALVLLPVVGAAMFVQAWRTRQWKKFFVDGTIIVVIAVALSAWWYVRNIMLYNDLLALDLHAKTTATRTVPFTLAVFLEEFPSFWFSFWGLFGSFNILMPQWVYTFFTALTFVGIGGGVVALVKGDRVNVIASVLREAISFFGRLLRREKHAPRNDVLELIAHAMLVTFIIGTAIGLVRWNLLSYSMQGRLMFTTLPIISMYLAAGLLAWSPAKHRKIVASVIIGAIGFIALFTASNTVAAAYLPPAPITESQLPSDLKPIRARLASGAELVGYKVESPQRVTSNDSIIVTLYWRSLVPMSADYNLFLHLLGQKQTLVGNVDTWTGGGLRPTSLWRVGEIYKDRYVITLDPKSKTPSKLLLDVAMWEKDSSRKLPITDEKGNVLKSVTVDVGLLDSAQPLIATPQARADSTLEGGIAFVGYDLPDNLIASQPITLTLYWLASSPIQNDYTVFVHVFDSQGKRVAQADSPPMNGDWLTSMWQTNRIVIDPHTFTLPSGHYAIRVGMYDPTTVEPLPAFRSDGSEWNERAIEVGRITVDP
ncbi:MAG: glycosyltransferase family 39 protein [Chloroflexota bacterium]